MAKYLYFADSSTEQYVVPVDRFLGADDTNATTLVLSFEDKNGTAANSTVTLTVNSGSAKSVFSTILNTISTGKDEVLVVADDVNKIYVDASITAVTGIAHQVTSTASTLTLGATINATGNAVDFDLIDNNASALSFDAAGKAGIINIVTTNSAEGVTMSGTLGVTGAATFTAGAQSSSVSVTATADGSGTGTIADGTSYATVTSDDANKIVVLPTPTPGNIVYIFVGANGYELRSSNPATVAINGGAGTDFESAVGANVLVRCVCTSATTWVATQFAADGTESAVEVAAA